jgi:hypothetical protein
MRMVMRMVMKMIMRLMKWHCEEGFARRYSDKYD